MQPLRAHSLAEARLYLKVAPCQDCSGGPWDLESETPPPAPTLRARCRHCGARGDFAFQCPDPESPGGNGAAASEAGEINPTPEPSEIIDVAQWLSLHYLLLESAEAATDTAEARRLTLQAAQCLDEALKFYTQDDELPPPSALFVESSRQAFAEHPENFARQRFRDMRSRLPDRRAVTGRLAQDAEEKPGKHWWRFWSL